MLETFHINVTRGEIISYYICLKFFFFWGGGGGVVDSDVVRVRVSYKVLALVPAGYLLKLNSSASV